MKLIPELIPDWKDAWKFWSVRAVAVLAAWNMMPASMQNYIPEPLHAAVSAVLFLSVIYLRIVPQPKLEKKHEN
ncbi:hypothetical protein AB1K62_14295 [Parasphingorhabdus sp. JC815]|uniref:DUF7940 domain-containing protein n=1 Tax=Parasphingorhabdus sp. JC815 TaxID=3232140 RepID=UPI003459AC8A